MPKSSPQVKRTIRTFAAATFFNDLGSDMISPVWPIFVTTVLKANMTALGFLDGLGISLISISKAFSGYFSDRLGKRKIFIWVGYLLASTARFGYSISTTWAHLVPFKILDRIGKERSAPRDAMVADVSLDSNRGSHFGYLRAMDHLGGMCGILLCIALIRFVGMRTIFILSAIPTLLSAVLIFGLIKEKKPGLDRKIFRIKGSDFNRNFNLFLVTSTIFSLSEFSYSFLLLYATGSGFSAPMLPVLYLIYTMSASLSSFYSGITSDRIGRKPVLFLSYGCWFLICLYLGFVHQGGRGLMVVVFIFYGVHKGILVPSRRTMVSEFCPPQFRASFLGFYQMITGLAMFPASVIAGLLWETTGKNTPFILASILTLVSSFFLIKIKSKNSYFRPKG